MKRMTQISRMVIGIAMLVALTSAIPAQAEAYAPCYWCDFHYQPAFVKIINPTEGSYIAKSPTSEGRFPIYTVPVDFVASVTDYAGKALNGYTLLWYVDGQLIGAGDHLTTAILTNCGLFSDEITVSAIDSAGHLVTDIDGSNVLDTITVRSGFVC